MINEKNVNTGVDSLVRTNERIQYGETVVWQVTDTDEYVFFTRPFVKRIVDAGERVVYFRYGKHEPLLEEGPSVKVVNLDMTEGFETFAMSVHDVIEENGNHTYYIFDNLTDLQPEWVSDFIIGNFFVVTAADIRKNDCVGFFCLIHNVHSFESIKRIRDNTSLLIDVFKDDKDLYVHPLKVSGRNSPSMFSPHKVDKKNGDRIVPLTNGVDVSRFYYLAPERGDVDSVQNLDYWERYFLNQKYEFSQNMDDTTRRAKLRELFKLVLTPDEKILDIADKCLDFQDMLEIKARMIGIGSIGGKATGMILSRMIIEKNLPEIAKVVEPHDSFYVCSNLYYTFLVNNDCWELKLKQRKKNEYFKTAKPLKEKILQGKFADDIQEQFRRMLEYYGQSPIIVRSSSMLEDGFENAFAGKYESVFCINSGPLEDRLEEFERAAKRIYASTMDEAVLEYRLQRGLSNREEKMGLLIQRVSGSLLRNIYMPAAAGVGYSYNSYRWSEDVDPKSGMLRIVMGLGTRAVEITGGDYPRIAALGRPEIRPQYDGEPSKYAQYNVDVLDFESSELKSMPLEEIHDKVDDWFWSFMIEKDYRREARLKELGIKKKINFTTCNNILRNKDFIHAMRKILNELEESYHYPVDIEFTVNISENGSFVINLLQCRPLQVGGTGIRKEIPANISKENTYFLLNGGTMGGSYYSPIDIVIRIDPGKYYDYPYKQKSYVARLLGEINFKLKDMKKNTMLLVPGRLGTTSPELGVSATFAEISNLDIVCEISYEEGGYMPELSFGSHFFQDLLENDIFYVAIFDNKDTTIRYDADFFSKEKNLIHEYVDDLSNPQLEEIISVYDMSDKGLTLISDIASGKTVCYLDL